MSLRESPVWKALVIDGGSPRPQIDSFATTLGPAELDELIRFIEVGSEAERDVAITVCVALRFVLRDDPVRFGPAQKERLSGALLQIARRDYPQHPGLPAALVLGFLNRSLTAAFLLHIQPDDHWDNLAIDFFLSQMSWAVDGWDQHFQEFSKAGGYLGERAAYYLESAGYISPEELNGLGEHFKRHKDAKTLNHIHRVFISHQVNKPIQPVIDLLGPADQRRGGAYIYNAEGVQLYMEQDKDGRLTGIKLK